MKAFFATLVVVGFTVFGAGLYSMSQPLNPAVYPQGEFAVYCLEGSKWKHVTVSFLPQHYDLYDVATGQFVARVPNDMCSLLPAVAS